MWALSHDKKSAILEHTFFKRYKYLQTDLIFGKSPEMLEKLNKEKEEKEKRKKITGESKRKKKKKKEKNKEINEKSSKIRIIGGENKSHVSFRYIYYIYSQFIRTIG